MRPTLPGLREVGRGGQKKWEHNVRHCRPKQVETTRHLQADVAGQQALEKCRRSTCDFFDFFLLGDPSCLDNLEKPYGLFHTASSPRCHTRPSLELFSSPLHLHLHYFCILNCRSRSPKAWPACTPPILGYRHLAETPISTRTHSPLHPVDQVPSSINAVLAGK